MTAMAEIRSVPAKYWLFACIIVGGGLAHANPRNSGPPWFLGRSWDDVELPRRNARSVHTAKGSSNLWSGLRALGSIRANTKWAIAQDCYPGLR